MQIEGTHSPEQTLACDAWGALSFGQQQALKSTFGGSDIGAVISGPDSVDWINYPYPDYGLARVRTAPGELLWHRISCVLFADHRCIEVQTGMR